MVASAEKLSKALPTAQEMMEKLALAEAEKALALVTLAFEVAPPPGLSSPSSILEK